MRKRNIGLTIYQALFFLLTSWIYTLSAYYIPFGETMHSLCEIYAFQGMPFGILLGIVLHYGNKPKKKDED